MTPSPSETQSEFVRNISKASTPAEAWLALDRLAGGLVGHKLFTVTTVEMDKGVARRVYTNHPAEYPVSGTKPIHRDRWFKIVHDDRRTFVANTIAEIADIFPDHALIASLGCGAVINLPVIMQDELVATINLLDAPHSYTPTLVAAAEHQLAVPARLCWALAQTHGGE